MDNKDVPKHTTTYTAVKVGTYRTEHDIKLFMKDVGRVEGPYYNEIYPETEFQTEEDALRWAYTSDPYADWTIIKRYTFDRD